MFVRSCSNLLRVRTNSSQHVHGTIYSTRLQSVEKENVSLTMIPHARSALEQKIV